MYILNAHYMFALTPHCAETREGFGGRLGLCQQALAKGGGPGV